jgi:hypothetical protein
MYGIDLKDLVDEIKEEKYLYANKIYNPVVVIAYDDFKEKLKILRQLNNLFGEFSYLSFSNYEYDDVVIDLRYVGKEPHNNILVACHCDILIYCYKKFDNKVLPELLPMLKKGGKFLTVGINRLITYDIKELNLLMDNILERDILLKVCKDMNND